MIGLCTGCCRVLEAADDIIVSVKSGSAVSAGEGERAIMGALPAAASLAVQSLLSSAPQKQLSSPSDDKHLFKVSRFQSKLTVCQ